MSVALLVEEGKGRDGEIMLGGAVCDDMSYREDD